ncbi:MAG: hypothetical protein K8S27_14930, partial [Candidatus Omnitrophica bacterium]|nr:hypothetical protein [Candidatus Omnitrophota bacterium]
WHHVDYTYTAGGQVPVKAEIQTPTPGSTFNSSSVTFIWDTGTSVTSYGLVVGTSVGTDNIYNSGGLTTTSANVSGIPMDGSTIYVRLYSEIFGVWEYNDYTYQSASNTPAEITSPVPDSYLTASENFTWSTGSGVSSYQLLMGTSVGGSDIYNSGQIPGTSATINNIPHGVATLHIRLYSLIQGSWQHNDYTYTSLADPAQIQSPVPGTTISLPDVLFQWDTGINVDAYQLTVGTSLGLSDIGDSGQTSTISYTVNNIPLNGQAIYVRLSSLISGAWQHEEYTYQTNVVKVIHFQGSGSGVHEGTAPSGHFQRVTYNIDVSFDVYAQNPTENNGYVTYELVRKVGDVHFWGTAEDIFGETTIVQPFNRTQNNLNIDGLEGIFRHSTTDQDDVYIEFDVPPGSASVPYLTYMKYFGSQLIVQPTFWMPEPWNQNWGGTQGYYMNVYDVPGFDDFNWACGITLDFEDKVLIPGDTTSVYVRTLVDQGDTLQWELIPGTDSTARAVLTHDGSMGKLATISDVKGDGELWVRVTNPSIANCQKEMPVYVGCGEICAAQSGKICLIEPKINIKSIDVQWGLGRTTRGNPVGNFYLRADLPDPANATPDILELYHYGEDTEKLYNGSTLRQILTPDVFINIEVVDAYNYDIVYYWAEDVGVKVNGYYEVNPAATPIGTWHVENPDAAPSVFHRLKITETIDTVVTAYEYAWDAVLQEWNLDKGSGLQVRTRKEEILGSNRVVTEVIKDSGNHVAAETETTYEIMTADGNVIEEIVQVVEDPNNHALTSTSTWYIDPTCNPGSCGQIESRQNPDGFWVKYEYDSLGRATLEISSWLDAPVSSTASSARAVYYDYSAQSMDDSELAEDVRRPRKITEEILGQVVGVTYYVYTEETDGTRTNIVERAATSPSSYGDPANQRTTTKTYPYAYGSVNAWRTRVIIYPDGRRDEYIYEPGTYTPDINPAVPGTFAFDAGTDEATFIYHGTTTNPLGIANKTTRERIISNDVGDVLLESIYVYNGTTNESLSWTVRQYDQKGRVIATYQSNSKVTESTWTCCDQKTETDDCGVVTDFNYDALNRLENQIKHAPAGNITTSYTYDAAGRQKSTTMTSGSLSLSSSQEYDSAGRLDHMIDEAGLTTGYVYNTNNRITTVTRPNSATEITEQYMDGQMKSVTGTGVVPQYYTSGVNSDGTRWTRVNIGSPSSTLWEKTTTDMLGRTIKTEKPGYSGVETVEHFYNNLGQLVRTASTGQADILYEYDELGKQVRSGLDINANGTLDLNSSDRVTENDTAFAYINNDWWQQNAQSVYATDNNATPTTTATQRARITGLGSGGVVAESVAIDIHGNQTISITD